MHKADKKIIRIHNPMMALPEFGFSGIEAYSTRASTDCGGITIMAHCGDPTSLIVAHEYLRQLGLGPEELILVKTPQNGDLYQAIREDRELCKKLVRSVQRRGYRIEFFCTRSDIESTFIREIGLQWSDVVSHPSELADTWNNKSELRFIARAHGLKDLFPKHHIVYGLRDLAFWVKEMLRKQREVVIKRPLWASGVGMVFGNDVKVMTRYLDQHGGVPPGTIVERSLGANHLSMSIVVRYEDGQVVDRWFTEQECPARDGSVVHEGSILGEMPRVTLADIEWMESETAPLYGLIRKNYPNLTGIVNFDCIRHADEQAGKRYVLECNARVTFSSYVQGIRKNLLLARDVGSGHHASKATCLVRKVVPSSARDFVSLASALGTTLLSNPTQSGVIPIVLGCLSMSGYCYLVAVADSYPEAQNIMAVAKTKLEA